jgi:hypothetical protein
VTLGSFLLVLACAARADSFDPESSLVVKSPNGKYWGRTTLPDFDDPALHESATNLYHFLVYSGQMSQSNLVRTVNLVNPDSPASVFLSNDGQSVATLDDWYSRGVGSNTLVIYYGDKMIRRYSLEDVASLSTEELKEHVKRSVTSRWWHEISASSFIESAGKPYFCIWLDWYSDWLVFDARTGDKIQLSDRLLTLCEERIEELLQYEMPDDEYVMTAGGGDWRDVTHPESLRERYLARKDGRRDPASHLTNDATSATGNFTTNTALNAFSTPTTPK